MCVPLLSDTESHDLRKLIALLSFRFLESTLDFDLIFFHIGVKLRIRYSLPPRFVTLPFLKGLIDTCDLFLTFHIVLLF